MPRSAAVDVRRMFGRGGWWFATAVLGALVVLVVASVQVRDAESGEGEAARQQAHAQAVSDAGEDVLAALVDAETGQRGYLITGQESFLQPYERALDVLPGRREALARAMGDAGRDRLGSIDVTVTSKLDELAASLQTYDTDGPDAAGRRVWTGVGNDLTESLRRQVDALISDARTTSDTAAAVAAAERDRAYVVVRVTVAVIGVLLLVMLAILRQRGQWEREREGLMTELELLATKDPLTGLLNRRMLEDRLDQALARADRQGTDVALAFVDLDGFKPVNDSLGHHQGDAVLVQVARALAAAVRDGDTVARVGGDEFVVLVEDFPGDRTAATILARLREASSVVAAARLEPGERARDAGQRVRRARVPA